MRNISPEELPFAERDLLLKQKNPQRPLLFRRMIVLANRKKASKGEILEAFKDIMTIRLMPNSHEVLKEKKLLSLSEAFALLMEPFSLKQLSDLQLLLCKML